MHYHLLQKIVYPLEPANSDFEYSPNHFDAKNNIFVTYLDSEYMYFSISKSRIAIAFKFYKNEPLCIEAIKTENNLVLNCTADIFMYSGKEPQALLRIIM